MDQFIIASHDLSNQIIPILLVFVLIFLIVLLSKISKLIDCAIQTIKKSHNTISLVDQSLNKVQVPLDTAVKLSGSVDKVHEAGIKFINDSAEYLNKNKNELKTKVDNVVLKAKTGKSKRVPSPEDIIGGK